MKIEYGTARRCINPQVPVSLAGYFNIRMWDREQALKLGVRQVVEEVERERRRRRQMRALIRDDLVRRGLV